MQAGYLTLRSIAIVKHNIWCGGLTLAGCQVSTKAVLSHPLLRWTGEREYNKRVMGQDNDRDITQQLLSWANQTKLGEKLMYYLSYQSREMRNKTKT